MAEHSLSQARNIITPRAQRAAYIADDIGQCADYLGTDHYGYVFLLLRIPPKLFKALCELPALIEGLEEDNEDCCTAGDDTGATGKGSRFAYPTGVYRDIGDPNDTEDDDPIEANGDEGDYSGALGEAPAEFPVIIEEGCRQFPDGWIVNGVPHREARP